MKIKELSMQEKVFIKSRDVITRRITGELFLVPIKGRLADMQRIFTLNPVAEQIWNSLDGKTGIREIHRGLVSAFEVGEEEAASDLKDFITELLKADLITEQQAA